MPRLFGLSVVVPVYRGQATVGALVEAVSALPIEGGLEIVLVNDGSPDDSLAACRRAAASARVPVTVVDHARNYGEHNAVMTGLRYARGDYVITMDDDLQNPPEEVARLYRHARSSGLDVVYTKYKDKEHAAWRNLGSRFTNRMADVLVDKPRGLYLSSFRCMSAFVVEQIAKYDGPFPYVDGLIMQVTQSIGTLEVKHLPRADGRSNYTLRRLIRVWLNMAVNFSVMPLRLATFLGFAFSALGLLGVLVVIVEVLLGETPQGWASAIVAVLLLSGTQLLILGIAGEYVGRLYMMSAKKPQAIVRGIDRFHGLGAETDRRQGQVAQGSL
jgi:undecaprenyl-phosphate 4-deoxy-4-formamido-L-arabinose transferase